MEPIQKPKFIKRVGQLLAVVVMTLWASLVTAGSVTTSLFTPVTGTVNVTTDTVQVVGSVHVVSRCVPTDPCQVYVNLVGVTGEGQTTGQRFLGLGAVDIAVPPNPIVTRASTFALLPVGSRGLPPNPIQPVEAMRVTLTLEFGTTGELLAVSALASTAPPPGGE